MTDWRWTDDDAPPQNADAKPSSKAVTQLLDQIEKRRSDADALAAIDKAREAWGPLTGPPPKRKSATHSHGKRALDLVQKILVFKDSPESLVLPEADAREAWLTLNALATRVVALYAQA